MGLSNARKVNWEGRSRARSSVSRGKEFPRKYVVDIPAFRRGGDGNSKRAKDEWSSGASGPQPPEVEVEDPFANAAENSRELIKDRLIKRSWDDMQSLVAGVLRAMGYKTKISDEGGDRGKDIVASRDGLGLEPPRIFVEVKHRKAQMGAPEVRKFIGGRNAHNDRCVYVSTGGFTTEAKYEAERSSVPLTLVGIATTSSNC